MNTEALKAWAQSALDDYAKDVQKGQPDYPQMAADVIELIDQHRVLVLHNEMLLARLKRLEKMV